MRFGISTLAAALLGGTAIIGMASAPASAAPLAVGSSLAAATAELGSPVVQVQRRRGRRGVRRGRRGGRGGGISPGGAAALGFIGAIGTMMAIDAARKAEGRAAYDADIQYCIDNFESYDIRSRSYLGFDGRRHACP